MTDQMKPTLEGAENWKPKAVATQPTEASGDVEVRESTTTGIDKDIAILQETIRKSSSMLDKYGAEIHLSKRLNERQVMQGQANERILKTRDGLKFKGDIINGIVDDTSGLTEEEQIRKAIETIDTYLSDIESRDPDETATWVAGGEPSYSADGSDTFEISYAEQESVYVDIKEKLNNMLTAMKATG